MKITAITLSVLTAIFLIATPAFSSSTPKSKTSTEKVVQGTVLTSTDSNLVIRKGKSDWSLTYDSASQKPSALTVGTPVLVHYRDEKNKHIVTTVEVTDAKTNTSQPQAK